MKNGSQQAAVFCGKKERLCYIVRQPVSAFHILSGGGYKCSECSLKSPEIAKRMTVISIIGGAYPNGGSEFNLQNDYLAANILFSSGVELWQVLVNCYSRMRVSYAELQEKVRPCGEIGRLELTDADVLGIEPEKAYPDKGARQSGRKNRNQPVFVLCQIQRQTDLTGIIMELIPHILFL